MCLRAHKDMSKTVSELYAENKGATPLFPHIPALDARVCDLINAAEQAVAEQDVLDWDGLFQLSWELEELRKELSGG